MSKLITISDDLYESLTRMKGKRSYTETIRSLLEKNRADIRRFFGVWKGRDTEELEKGIAEDRKKHSGRPF